MITTHEYEENDTDKEDKMNKKSKKKAVKKVVYTTEETIKMSENDRLSSAADKFRI